MNRTCRIHGVACPAAKLTSLAGALVAAIAVAPAALADPASHHNAQWPARFPRRRQHHSPRRRRHSAPSPDPESTTPRRPQPRLTAAAQNVTAPASPLAAPASRAPKGSGPDA
jgi:hypothetical protein